MAQIFINLPVNDLEKAKHFYLALGFTFNPIFSGEHQTCLLWSEAIFLMLQSKSFFTSYVNKPLTDAKSFQTTSHTLPVASVQQVDAMLKLGLEAGGTEPVPVLQEPFMYLRSIEDLDGYLWGILCLDIDKFKALNAETV